MSLAAELRALGERATEGPWRLSEYEFEVNDYRNVIRADEAAIASVGNMAATSDHCPTSMRWKKESPANAAMIVALRNNLPTIIAALEAQEKNDAR